MSCNNHIEQLFSFTALVVLCVYAIQFLHVTAQNYLI